MRAPERPADGLLPARVARARRAAARGGGALARREPQRAPSARWRARRCGSASSTCARSSEEEAKALVAERDRRGPFGGVRELAQRSALDRPRLEAIVASGACDSFEGGRRALLWELGLAPRAQTVPGSGGEERQLALPLDPTAETPALREHTAWERMLADYRTTSLSVGVHPLDAAEAAPAGGNALEPRAGGRAHRPLGVGGRDGRGAAAAGDRERRRLHAARGRVRPGQPDRASVGLRAVPGAGAGRAAAPGARALRALRAEPQRPRPRARLARARSPGAVPTTPTSSARCPAAHHFGHR